MTQKNKILLVTGIGDTFFSPNSSKKLEYGGDLESKISKVVKTIGSRVYKNFINLNTSFDTNKDINVFKDLANTKVLNYKLQLEDSLFSQWNHLITTTLDNETKIINASDLDFILPPQNYEIHICGVDLNGFYKTIIPELLAKGYKVVLYSDLMKRFKNTEAVVTSIKHKNFEYCSYKSVTI